MRASLSSRAVLPECATVPGEGSSLPRAALAGDTLITGGDHAGA